MIHGRGGIVNLLLLPIGARSHPSLSLSRASGRDSFRPWSFSLQNEKLHPLRLMVVAVVYVCVSDKGVVGQGGEEMLWCAKRPRVVSYTDRFVFLSSFLTNFIDGGLLPSSFFFFFFRLFWGISMGLMRHWFGFVCTHTYVWFDVVGVCWVSSTSYWFDQVPRNLFYLEVVLLIMRLNGLHEIDLE